MLKNMENKLLFTEEQIAQRIARVAKEIARDYQGQTLVVIGILKGAFVITADLVRALYKAGDVDIEVSFLMLKSYYESTRDPKDIQLVMDSDLDPRGRHVLIVDDVFDTGKSFAFLDLHIREKGATSVAAFALLAKPDRHEVVYRPKHIGFNVGNVWVEGYGMDSIEKGRGNPSVIGKDHE